MPQIKQFKKSTVACLLRHRSGKYYASAKVSGKVIRRCLDTDDCNVAKNRLDDALADMRGAKKAVMANTLLEAVQEEASRVIPDGEDSTQHYYEQVAVALEKVAASLEKNPLTQPISKVTFLELRKLMDKFAAQYCATRYNGGLALLRRTFEQAIEEGYVAKNAAKDLKRRTPEQKEYDLPTAEDFAKVVASILSQKKSHSKASAMAVEFMGYTGLRISEAQKIRWRNIKEDWMTARNAKNGLIRQIPLIPAAQDLLNRLRSAGVPTGPNDPVMLVKSPRISLDNACERLDFDHLRIHDLRHIFATRCIEAGVDFATLAGWLGHQDGGILCAKTYGHLCKKHSSEMAKLVKA